MGWGHEASGSGTPAPLTELQRVTALRPLLPPPPFSSPRLFLSRSCNTPSTTLPSLPPPRSLFALIFSQFSGLGLQLWPLGLEVPAGDRAVIITPVSTSAPQPAAPGSYRDLPGPLIPDSAAAAAA